MYQETNDWEMITSFLKYSLLFLCYYLWFQSCCFWNVSILPHIWNFSGFMLRVFGDVPSAPIILIITLYSLIVTSRAKYMDFLNLNFTLCSTERARFSIWRCFSFWVSSNKIWSPGLLFAHRLIFHIPVYFLISLPSPYYYLETY